MSKYRYVCSGNIMSDQVQQPDGSLGEPHIGGPALFSYAGVKLYDDNCIILSGVGSDFNELYGEWCKNNGVDQSQLWRMVEKTHRFILKYNPEDGTYDAVNMLPLRQAERNMGLCEPTGHRFGLACDNKSVLYYTHDTFNWASWENIFAAKKEKNFQFMWEIHAASAVPSQVSRIEEVFKHVEMFSINYPEMRQMLGNISEKEAIAYLQQKFGKFCILRVGKRGMYTIWQNKSAFIPSIDSEKAVDATGCGNCSTGAAMYGWCETQDYIMAGIMGNIAAGYNVRQYGPYPKFTQVERQEALALARELRAAFKE